MRLDSLLLKVAIAAGTWSMACYALLGKDDPMTFVSMLGGIIGMFLYLLIRYIFRLDVVLTKSDESSPPIKIVKS